MPSVAYLFIVIAITYASDASDTCDTPIYKAQISHCFVVCIFWLLLFVIATLPLIFIVPHICSLLSFSLIFGCRRFFQINEFQRIFALIFNLFRCSPTHWHEHTHSGSVMCYPMVRRMNKLLFIKIGI